MSDTAQERVATVGRSPIGMGEFVTLMAIMMSMLALSIDAIFPNVLL